MDGRRPPPETSNFYCLPGRAGGFPMVLKTWWYLEQQGSTLHCSVLKRAERTQKETGRPDLLAVTEKVEFVVNTNLPWFRTGIIIESGKCYRLTYLGGLTRDATCPPCGPSGQKAAGLFDVRHIFTPRLPDDNSMALAASVAHPRIWTPRELGMGRGSVTSSFALPARCSNRSP